MSFSIRTPPSVVKLGGSLLGTDHLDDLLAIASRYGAVIVPGGGPFADAVRQSQAIYGFDDGVAHRMAIRAMEQTAELLVGRFPALIAVEERDSIAAAAAAESGSVWLPSQMALEARLPASWAVTSDSLALWLAIELRAPRLILLKATDVASECPMEWAVAGVADAYLPTLARDFAGELLCVGPASPAALEAALAAPRRIAA